METIANGNQFSVLSSIPRDALTQMHPDTKKIIEQIKGTKGKVLACRMKTPREAKNRLDALRRAKARGQIRYKEGRRKGNMLYIGLR